MRYMPSHKEMLPGQPRSTPRDILRNDGHREMARTWAQRVSQYERRILVLRSILWEISEWDRTEGTEREFKRLVELIHFELDRGELWQ